MAARNQHVQDSAVAERRLRPIYEWLDSGNPKKALQEAEKVLRKTPNLQCAKALKALSLLQVGREAECVAILNVLTGETPSDNSTLQAMTICYRDLGQLEKVCQLYENAVNAEPTNEELHTHLFMSYVRTSNFKMQQQAAMVLYKLKPKNPYYFWAVMSIVLQGTRGPGATDPAKRRVLLALAERMIDKLIVEGRLEAEQEVQLYMMVLELQGKWAEALAALDGPLATKLHTGLTHLHRIPYLLKLQRWTDLNVLCNDLLTTQMDRWDIWNFYITSMFELAKEQNCHVNNHVENHENASPSEDCVAEGPDDTPERVHEFISSVIENTAEDNLFKSSSSYQLRGPYLARFELCARLKKLGRDPTYLLGDTFELFVEYFRLFGHKPCCVSDLRVYLHLLEPSRRTELAARLLKDVGISSTTLPQSEKQMQRHICSLEVSRLCGNQRNLDVEYLVALVTALSLHYQNGCVSFGGDRVSTDQGPADAYALLAAHTLYDVALATSSAVPLITALVLLEELLHRSPSNFHAKLLCVRLYHLVGGGHGAQRIYDALDTKHVQIDSLGFVHCARMQATGLFALTATLYDATLKFFTTNYRDSIDHLTFSYKFGSFMKLEEFMDFRERLNNSLHYTITAIDRMLLEMVLCPNLKGLHNIDASPKNNNIDWQNLRDNSDYGVYLSWDPERVEQPLESCDAVKEHFEQERDLARIRATMLCGVSSAVDILKSTEENREQCIKTLREVHTDWLSHFETIQTKKYQFVPLEHISLPLGSRLHCHLVSPYKSVVGGLLQLVLNVAAGSKEDSGAPVKHVQGALLDMKTSIESLVKEQNDAEDKLWNKSRHMEMVVNSIEIVSISALVSGVCCELVKRSLGGKGGRSKKKCPRESETKERLLELIGAVKECAVALDKQLEMWQPPKCPAGLEDRLGALALPPTTSQHTVLELLRTSHTDALKDLRATLHSKIKYVNTLIC